MKLDVLPGERAELNETAAAPTLDELLSNAREARPGMQPQMVMHDPGAAETTYVAMGESVEAPVTQAELLQFDRATGTLLSGSRYDEGFMGFMLRLHVELFAGLPGTLFLGVMSMVFLVALVSERGDAGDRPRCERGAGVTAEALRRPWAWPTALGAGISFGLVCALVADGSWDLTGALCLAAPGAFCLWLTARRPVRRPAADEPLDTSGVGPDRGPSPGRMTEGRPRDGR